MSGPVAAFEDDYVGRARAAVDDRLSDVRAISVGRSAESGDGKGPVLGGWWAQPEPGLLVLPNPWDERDAIPLYEAHCWDVMRRIVSRVAPVLDDLWGEDRAVEDWNLLLGPWLLHVVSALADRRLFCLAASELAPEARFLTVPSGAAPATMGEGVEALRTEDGNRALISAIVGALGLPSAPAAPSSASTAEPGSGATFGHRARKFGSRPFHHVARLATQAVLCARPGRKVTLLGHVDLTPSEAIRVALRVPSVRRDRPPALAAALDAPPPEAAALRQRLARLQEGAPDGLEGLATSLLPSLLPRSVLEGWDQLVATARTRYGAPTHLLVGNYAADEAQNEYIARCREAGRRISFVQHGGFYLQALANGQERLELRDGCEFLSWGAAGAGVRPLPSPKLERIRGRHRGGRAVVVVEFLEPPDAYLIRFASHPLANQAFGPAELLAEFVRSVEDSRAQLVLKRFPSHLDTRRRRPAALEALPYELAAGGAVDWMAQARVAVVPYPDTPFIEALVLGVPTIGLWNRSVWELRPSAQPAFAALADAGVIHDDPRAAAAHLDEIYADPRRWWDSEPTLAARRAFIEGFATPGDWLAAWTAYLRGMAAT